MGVMPSPATSAQAPEGPSGPATPGPADEGLRVERQGRRWLLWSFLACPCHLPVSLGVLGAVLAGTSLGAMLRDHAIIAGAVLTTAWLAGTGYGFHLIGRARRAGGACPVRRRGTGTAQPLP